MSQQILRPLLQPLTSELLSSGCWCAPVRLLLPVSATTAARRKHTGFRFNPLIRLVETHGYYKMSVFHGEAGHFMYFAFGSNLLKERLQLANPSAVFCTTGRLKDYKLNFGLWEKHVDNVWHGGVATIESCPGAEVWGVIWTLSNDNLPSLDNQEGVNLGKYSPLEVSVETDKGLVLCRSYQMNNFHACLPSPQYKQVVCLGAEQNGLPAEYLRRLEAIQTNNYSGPSILDQIRTVMK